MTSNYDSEKRRQSELSPGRITNREKILLAVIEPMNWNSGDFTSNAFQTKNLENCAQSVARQRYSSPKRLHKFVIDILLSRKSERLLKGVISIPAHQLRAAPTVGATQEFIIVDAPYWVERKVDFAHAHVGFSPDVMTGTIGTPKSRKVAAVANLKNALRTQGKMFEVPQCFLRSPWLYCTAAQLWLCALRAWLWLSGRTRHPPEEAVDAETEGGTSGGISTNP
ncbi:hypothetical protein PQR72_34755 [Paraburkholderia madseniana]|uniref:hypothetical protein n=1 Tax=Paraburkholderia madseniana TaxID=2599607 RepID=UPI0015C56587|nr:hypothetical protein [Paraburkholderia madseniana]NPT63626.1 hypothetical protein [Paraburkholderia madseniana]